MTAERGCVCLFRRLYAAVFVAAVLGMMAVGAWAQDSPSADAPPEPDRNVPVVQERPAPVERPQAELDTAATVDTYDPGIFEMRIPPQQLVGLDALEGETTNQAIQDRAFKKLLKQFVPDCTFHYGRDMSMESALEMVLLGSGTPVQVRDGRYMTLAGNGGPYLGGRGFLWIDMKEGIGLGAFYFHPTNGEPTPSVAVFSRQVRVQAMGMSDLPPAFAQDLQVWAGGSRVPAVTTRYFITGGNRRILLEHDEDYCGAEYDAILPNGSDCMEMNADAADKDEVAAYYLDQVHYRTNATAWMIGPDQQEWLVLRDRTCGVVADALGCRIRVTRQHVHVLTGRPGPRPRPVEHR